MRTSASLGTRLFLRWSPHPRCPAQPGQCAVRFRVIGRRRRKRSNGSRRLFASSTSRPRPNALEGQARVALARGDVAMATKAVQQLLLECVGDGDAAPLAAALVGIPVAAPCNWRRPFATTSPFTTNIRNPLRGTNRLTTFWEVSLVFVNAFGLSTLAWVGADLLPRRPPSRLTPVRALKCLCGFDALLFGGNPAREVHFRSK